MEAEARAYREAGHSTFSRVIRDGASGEFLTPAEVVRVSVAPGVLPSGRPPVHLFRILCNNPFVPDAAIAQLATPEMMAALRSDDYAAYAHFRSSEPRHTQFMLTSTLPGQKDRPDEFLGAVAAEFYAAGALGLHAFPHLLQVDIMPILLHRPGVPFGRGTATYEGLRAWTTLPPDLFDAYAAEYGGATAQGFVRHVLAIPPARVRGDFSVPDSPASPDPWDPRDVTRRPTREVFPLFAARFVSALVAEVVWACARRPPIGLGELPLFSGRLLESLGVAAGPLHNGLVALSQRVGARSAWVFAQDFRDQIYFEFGGEIVRLVAAHGPALLAFMREAGNTRSGMSVHLCDPDTLADALLFTRSLKWRTTYLADARRGLFSTHTGMVIRLLTLPGAAEEVRAFLLHDNGIALALNLTTLAPFSDSDTPSRGVPFDGLASRLPVLAVTNVPGQRLPSPGTFSFWRRPAMAASQALAYNFAAAEPPFGFSLPLGRGGNARNMEKLERDFRGSLAKDPALFKQLVENGFVPSEEVQKKDYLRRVITAARNGVQQLLQTPSWWSVHSFLTGPGTVRGFYSRLAMHTTQASTLPLEGNKTAYFFLGNAKHRNHPQPFVSGTVPASLLYYVLWDLDLGWLYADGLRGSVGVAYPSASPKIVGGEGDVWAPEAAPYYAIFRLAPPSAGPRGLLLRTSPVKNGAEKWPNLTLNLQRVHRGGRYVTTRLPVPREAWPEMRETDLVAALDKAFDEREPKAPFNAAWHAGFVKVNGDGGFYRAASTDYFGERQGEFEWVRKGVDYTPETNKSEMWK